MAGVSLKRRDILPMPWNGADDDYNTCTKSEIIFFAYLKYYVKKKEIDREREKEIGT